MTSTLSRAIAHYPNRFDPGAVSDLPEHIRETIHRRERVLGPGYTLIYKEPVEFVSGHGAHLIDRDGNDYLDAYNNVPCVGHAHPHVAEAVARQMTAVNTNTRYVQEALVDYAERLLATFPEELSKLSIACSGSEANDLAVRVARFHTGGEGIIVTRWAYHGLTREVASFSPTLGTGSPLGPNVRLIDAPDPRLVAPGSTLDGHMRQQVRGAIDDLERHGYRLAALITDCAYSSDGIFTDPPRLHAGRGGGGARGRRCLHRGRGPVGIRPARGLDVGLQPPRRAAGHRHHGQADGQRSADLGCGLPPRGLRGVRTERPLLQHLRRQLHPREGRHVQTQHRVKHLPREGLTPRRGGAGRRPPDRRDASPRKLVEHTPRPEHRRSARSVFRLFGEASSRG
ncbi:hypothetical protein QFZ55_007842 [Streptomyces luteogriseus]|nr:hypothetical protein [Streptomyces luteogriseus]